MTPTEMGPRGGRRREITSTRLPAHAPEARAERAMEQRQGRSRNGVLGGEAPPRAAHAQRDSANSPGPAGISHGATAASQ